MKSSITKFKDMAAEFDPSPIEELSAFKTKYQKEHEPALGQIKKASELLENSDEKYPSSFR
jgi:hypothetical protein